MTCRSNFKNSGTLFGLISLVALSVTTTYSYLLFHSIVEIFSVIVSCGIFIIAWNARRFMNNSYFLFIGIACLFVGIIDLLHTLAYKDMGVFTNNDPNLPTQLWISARYLQSLSFFLAPFYMKRRVRSETTLIVFAVATALLLASVFAGAFPDCFHADTGLTVFKIVSEYVVIILLFGALAGMTVHRQDFDKEVFRLLAISFAALICSEIAFTLYTDVFGIFNQIGHLLKVVGFFYIYKALIEIGLTRPYDLLFRELKKSEEALLQEKNELAASKVKLSLLNAELENRANELEAANLELEAFNYSVSHDLRAPLNNISGSSQVLLQVHKERLDDSGRYFLEAINTETSRMAKLIETLLNFSRLNRKEIQSTEVDLSAMARGIVLELQAREPLRNVEITIADGATCHGDPELMQVVLKNLIGNAWKYTTDTDKPAIELGMLESEKGTEFFVKDNGAGFDDEMSYLLFKPFQRLHSSSEYEGFGIGLATVQRIIKRHGGQIRAEGQVGEGATFYFTI